MRRRHGSSPAGEDGYALASAILVMLVVLLLGTAAVVAALSSNGTARRDQSTKRALQAADAGVDSALLRMNSLSEVLNDPLRTLPCVASAGGVLSLNNTTASFGTSITYCTAANSPEPERLGNDATFSYRTSVPLSVDLDSLSATTDRRIVAIGTAGSGTTAVSRRVLVDVSGLSVTRLLAADPVSASGNVTLNGSASGTSVTGDVLANGSISLLNTATVSGNATAGPGQGVSVAPTSSVTGTRSNGPRTLNFPTIDVSKVSVSNNNGSLCALATCVNGQVCTTVFGDTTCVGSGSVDYNAANRTLSASGTSTVILTGGTYVLCSLNLSGSARLILSSLGETKIYIDKPENCGGVNGSVSVTGSSQIVGTALQSVGLFVVGSTNAALGTTVAIANSASGLLQSALAVYAPNSDITLSDHTLVNGGVSGKSVTLLNQASVSQSTNLATLLNSALSSVGPLYRRTAYRECSSMSAFSVVPSNPGAGC